MIAANFYTPIRKAIVSRRIPSILILLFCYHSLSAQLLISDFVSLEPSPHSTEFTIAESHVFQKIIESGDPLSAGGFLPINNDFTGYVPIDGSSENGFLSINSETSPGGVSILDIYFDPVLKHWVTTASEAVDFSSVVGTINNCSGAITPWNTIISCEEKQDVSDLNLDGYYDMGWCVEISPESKTVIDKLWALGNFKHENVAIHSNLRTIYQGADSNPGYLYKFIAQNPGDLSEGTLYVYSGSKNGQGNWILLNNATAAERNSTLQQSALAGATVFNGIEDVEIGPDGLVYFAVKNEDRVYRFQDSDPLTGTTVLQMETYVGNASYDITHKNGTTNVNWGNGNDNLAFDGEGNLWVTQDRFNDTNYIWVVESGHSQADPKVKIFGIAPIGSEPTGITFSPDYRFLFMSVQHPNSNNDSSIQFDTQGEEIGFEKNISLVIALKENLGTLWYLDADGDGFATAATLNSHISPGAGYVSTPLPTNDCDDQNAAINPNTTWYLDADGDQHAAATTVNSCVQPGLGYTTEELPTDDCNDNDPDIILPTLWYLDADGDGFATEITVTSCINPGEGYTNEILPTTDCDDSDASLNPGTVWYLDADADGYASEITVVGCYHPGDGYTTEELPQSDCDDNNSEAFMTETWFLDSDNNGYAEGDPVLSCGSPGEGYTTVELPGEEEAPQTGKVVLFPNPSEGDININLDKVYQQIEISVLSASEQLLLKKTFRDTRGIHIQMPYQSSGIYYIHISLEGEKIAVPIIITR
ncbi:alkaline phosphatase PhoX [Muriicola sp. Z0-33]|uniref:alkaline phosphatase PhoX n=1 Tax=Muriicola sp. Z0-33 TaxID=2816957 RepID=UPI0022378CE9|nr:alkaline phosphatase PhoX [Muriicola sp. Z0-33]MCW5517279.1 DUF839 domain-containing protein [Muriicola sp. Z0-33]